MTETELTPLIWERDGDNRYAQDGDSGYYSITKGERLFGRDTFRLQFTPREEYDKPNPQRRSAFQHMSPELAEQHAEEDRLYRIREAERAERAAKCTIKIPTLSWIPADGGFISDPPGYIVRLTEAGRYNIEHNGRIASSFADFEDVKRTAQRWARDGAIGDHFDVIAGIVDEFVRQDSGDTRILRTLAAYRLMRVAAADIYINTSSFAMKVGNGVRDVIFFPEHCWLAMDHLMLDCTPPAFPALWPHANWAFKPNPCIVADVQFLEYRLKPDGSLESPPWLGEYWGVPDNDAGFIRKIQKVQMLEGGRILAETERLRALAAERQGVPYCRDDTVYPLRFNGY